MIRFLKHIFFLLFIFNLTAASAQNGRHGTEHKVVAGETVYGISHKYGLSVDELKKANPGMNSPEYGLKAGDVIVIPARGAQNVSKGVKKGSTINIGVMLPLNSNSSEGKNMVEYYRGVLMACETLKKEHFNINVHAWDVSKNADVSGILKEAGAASCDLIIGPYYSHQVAKVSDFAKKHNIRMALPTLSASDEVMGNRNIYVMNVFNPAFYNTACEKFFALFEKTNPIIVDCNDPNNGKGDFTTAARHYFDKEDIKYNITNINSEDKSFIKAFKKNRNNIVILNSSGMNAFSSAVAKIKAVRKKYPEIKISMIGYNEWFSFEKYKLADFAANDVYIPTYFYYNSHSASTKKIEADYFRWFGNKMLQTTPRYAITGYDHTMFFLRGINRFGGSFTGSKEQNGGNVHIQTPMHFEKVSMGGGYRNEAFMFIHYKKDQSIESLAY